MVKSLLHYHTHGLQSQQGSVLIVSLILLLVIGIALLMTRVGLSPALGTFLAGVLLATTYTSAVFPTTSGKRVGSIATSTVVSSLNALALASRSSKSRAPFSPSRNWYRA